MTTTPVDWAPPADLATLAGEDLEAHAQALEWHLQRVYDAMAGDFSGDNAATLERLARNVATLRTEQGRRSQVKPLLSPLVAVWSRADGPVAA